tara:strand:- start:47 stop:253 length:207 start_codon:yes stop_codon:yes gene_type:complete
MINLKEYNEQELSLLVFNTESLYNLKDNESGLLSEINSRYIYSKKQLSILLKDIEDSKLEFNRYKFEI